MLITIVYSDEARDYDYLSANDRHVRPEVLRSKIQQREVIVIQDDGRPVGWLRYGYFWDEFPFMSMLMLEEGYRRKGLGRKLVEFWEKEMSDQGHDSVMTSSLANEQAQHFYRTLGYVDCGALLLPGEALEIFFRKVI